MTEAEIIFALHERQCSVYFYSHLNAGIMVEVHNFGPHGPRFSKAKYDGTLAGRYAALAQCAREFGVDAPAEMPLAIGVRYWAHPESDSVFVTLADEDPRDSGTVDGAHCHEITQAAYLARREGGLA